MRFLVVLAHPLAGSFAASVAATARQTLEARGHEVDFLDLYGEEFDPCLSAAERRSYFSKDHDVSTVAGMTERLKAANGLILVFPQWWFNFPAILKGFLDRVFAPGIAFDNDPAGGRIVPRLTNIKVLWALTTTGSPWWVVNLYMGNPVQRLLKRAIAAGCIGKPDFRMLSLHDMDRASPEKRERHLNRVRKAVSSL